MIANMFKDKIAQTIQQSIVDFSQMIQEKVTIDIDFKDNTDLYYGYFSFKENRIVLIFNSIYKSFIESIRKFNINAVKNVYYLSLSILSHEYGHYKEYQKNKNEYVKCVMSTNGYYIHNYIKLNNNLDYMINSSSFPELCIDLLRNYVNCESFAENYSMQLIKNTKNNNLLKYFQKKFFKDQSQIAIDASFHLLLIINRKKKEINSFEMDKLYDFLEQLANRKTQGRVS